MEKYRPHSIYREATVDTRSTSSEHALFAPLQPLGEDVFESSLRKRDTVIYFHGNVSSFSTVCFWRISGADFDVCSGDESCNASSGAIVHGLFKQARCVSNLSPQLARRHPAITR
jgi:hypothetical protein